MTADQRKTAERIIKDASAIIDIQEMPGWQVLLNELDTIQEEIIDDKQKILRSVDDDKTEKKILALSYRYDAVDYLRERIVGLIESSVEAKQIISEKEENNISNGVIETI